MNPYWKKNTYKKEQKVFTRVNFNIKVPNVRVIKDGEQLGIMSTDKARKLAQDANLDLVEIAPTAKPPVCHIIDFEKFKYERELKEKEQRKNQKNVVMKEVRLSPSIEEHDVDYKLKAAQKFLEAGKKVKLNLKFERRELAHKDIGFEVMKKAVTFLSQFSKVEKPAKMEGKDRIICILEPITAA